MQSVGPLRTAVTIAWLACAAHAGAAPGNEPAPADDRLGAAIAQAERALERGVRAAGQGVRAGVAAAARGVERAASATAKAAESVARRLERRGTPETQPEPERRRGANAPPRSPNET